MGKWHPEDLKRKANEFMDFYQYEDARCDIIIILLSRQFGMSQEATLNKIKRMARGEDE